ncbi:MAG TPA: tetratricopeptide repeat protein [Bacteroidales bacterium]|nr:tetratricopeptide repeat protein [Bacteroidales bacterium]
MTKKKGTTKGIENVEQTLTQTEQFLEENYKPMLYGLIALVVLVGLFWLVRLYMSKQDKEAQNQMFMAEQYFAQDSLRLALYGNGNDLGFIDIAKDYKITKSGKLANFYTGTCFMHLGEFEQAINYLEKYSLKDEILAPEAKALIGDANVELGDSETGIKYYLEASEMADNSFHSPIYLLKAGELYETDGKFAEALKLYEMIQDKYPESNEGRSIDKYIARVKLHTN